MQRAAHALPGLTGLLGAAYLTRHLAVTAGILLWLHQRRPAAFPFVRMTLLLATGSPSSASSSTRQRHRA